MKPIPPTPSNILGVRALALRKQGKTWPAIARTFGKSYWTVYGNARRIAAMLGEPIRKGGSRLGRPAKHPLSVLIQRQGFTVHDVSSRTGIPRMTLGDWIRGTCRPPTVGVQKIASAIGVDPETVAAALRDGVRPEAVRAMAIHTEGQIRAKAMFAAWQKGETYTEIAARWNVSAVWALKIVKAHGRSIGLTLDQMARRDEGRGQCAYNLRMNGWSWPQIDTELGYRPASSISIAKRYALKSALPWPPE